MQGIPPIGTATFSDCRRYRYRLGRVVGAGVGTVFFIGVNPSTASAEVDDQTVRKWRGFSARWGYVDFFVGNLFAWRSTDVNALALVDDPVGPENDRHLEAMLALATIVVPCWGSADKLPERLHPRIGAVREMLARHPGPVKCLGRTRSGDPRHPLTLGYDTALEAWQ